MKKYFYALQGAKGLAALFIAVGHFVSWKGNFTMAYTLMCDFFFMCSGMTSWNKIEDSIKTGGHFDCKWIVIKKIQKIYFPYFIVCLFWLAFNKYVVRALNSKYTSVICLMLLQCMGFASNGEEILISSPIGIAWYISVDFWLGTFFLITLIKSCKSEIKTVFVCTVLGLLSWNILCTSSPNYMDIHYAKLMLGNYLTLTYAMIRCVLGYSMGILCGILNGYIRKWGSQVNDLLRKRLCSLAEILLVIIFIFLYGSPTYQRENEFIFPVFCFAWITVICLESGVLSKLLAGKLLQYLGEYSYYLYLTHIIAMYVVRAYFRSESTVTYLLLSYFFSYVLKKVHSQMQNCIHYAIS